jgi:hypothetical protein
MLSPSAKKDLALNQPLTRQSSSTYMVPGAVIDIFTNQALLTRANSEASFISKEDASI